MGSCILSTSYYYLMAKAEVESLIQKWKAPISCHQSLKKTSFPLYDLPQFPNWVMAPRGSSSETYPAARGVRNTQLPKTQQKARGEVRSYGHHFLHTDTDGWPLFLGPPSIGSISSCDTQTLMKFRWCWAHRLFKWEETYWQQGSSIFFETEQLTLSVLPLSTCFSWVHSLASTLRHSE